MEDHRRQPRERGGDDGAVPPQHGKARDADAAGLGGQRADERVGGQQDQEEGGERESHDDRIIANRGRMAEALNPERGEDMPERIKRVMVVTAHPDDSEFGAGGTVAKLTREGKAVIYCILTNGNKGSSDRSMTPERLVGIREEEQKNAARVLGVDTVDFLGFPDCELENTRESRMAVTAAIRRHKPDLIICQNPNRTKNLGGSHRDHRVAAGIALDCVYPLARDHMAFPELMAQGLEPHRVKEVHMMWWDDPEVVVDTSDTIDLKIKALQCHVSQMQDMTAMEKRVRERGALLGKPKGFAYAETFDRILIER